MQNRAQLGALGRNSKANHIYALTKGRGKKKSWARKEKQHSTEMKNCMEKKIEGGGLRGKEVSVRDLRATDSF